MTINEKVGGVIHITPVSYGLLLVWDVNSWRDLLVLSVQQRG
jgi:hypothetical protein